MELNSSQIGLIRLGAHMAIVVAPMFIVSNIEYIEKKFNNGHKKLKNTFKNINVQEYLVETNISLQQYWTKNRFVKASKIQELTLKMSNIVEILLNED